MPPDPYPVQCENNAGKKCKPVKFPWFAWPIIAVLVVAIVYATYNFLTVF